MQDNVKKGNKNHIKTNLLSSLNCQFTFHILIYFTILPTVPMLTHGISRANQSETMHSLVWY